MEKFMVTFGVKYRREAHPRLGLVNPSGYLVISAPNEEEARSYLSYVIGEEWAFIYREEQFDASHYPSGALAVWSTAFPWVPVDPWVWSRRMLDT